MKYTFILFIFTLVVSKNIFDLNKLKLDIDETKEKRKNIANLNDLASHLSSEKNDKRQDVLQTQHQGILLSGILPQLRSISIFASYLREDLNLVTQIESSKNPVLIIAPDDQSIESLSMKPWEFPKEVNSSSNGKENDEIIKDNIEHFVSGHLCSQLSCETIKGLESGIQTITLNNNNQVDIRKQDSKYQIQLNSQSEWINVEEVKVSENGLIFIINQCLIVPT